jgi:hypothetical protein
MKLSQAVQQVGPEENIEAAFTRLFGDQAQPEQFRKLFNTVRRVPQEMIQKIQQNAELSPDAAFKVIHPDYVNVGEFMTAVLESRKQQASVQTPVAPVAEPEEITEG